MVKIKIKNKTGLDRKVNLTPYNAILIAPNGSTGFIEITDALYCKLTEDPLFELEVFREPVEELEDKKEDEKESEDLKEDKKEDEEEKEDEKEDIIEDEPEKESKLDEVEVKKSTKKSTKKKEKESKLDEVEVKKPKTLKPNETLFDDIAEGDAI